jgi:hypothetical protein
VRSEGVPFEPGFAYGFSGLYQPPQPPSIIARPKTTTVKRTNSFSFSVLRPQASGDRLQKAKDVFAGLRIEAIIQDGVGRIQRRLRFDRWVANAQFAIIANSQLAANL